MQWTHYRVYKIFRSSHCWHWRRKLTIDINLYLLFIPYATSSCCNCLAFTFYFWFWMAVVNGTVLNEFYKYIPCVCCKIIWVFFFYVIFYFCLYTATDTLNNNLMVGCFKDIYNIFILLIHQNIWQKTISKGNVLNRIRAKCDCVIRFWNLYLLPRDIRMYNMNYLLI